MDNYRMKDVSILRAVTWQVGKGGVVTPVGHFDSVDLCGATCEKASLDSVANIQRLGLTLGARVIVRRAGQIIPRVERRLPGRAASERPILPPSECPACRARLFRQGVSLFCLNPACSGQAAARIAHYASTDAMNIRGLSIGVAQQLVDRLGCQSPADLYAIRAENLRALDGFGAQRAENVSNAIQSARQKPLAVTLYALSVPMVGQRAARLLAERFDSLAAVAASSAGSFSAVDGIGEYSAQLIADWFSSPYGASLVAHLRALHVA